MNQAEFNRQKKIAGTPAWYLANGRDHSANLTVAVRALTALVKGIPASVLKARVKRRGAGTGQEVDLATLLAYDLDNETREKDTDAKILAALTSIEQRLTALETTKQTKGA